MTVEHQVVAHYTRGSLEDRILGALRSAGHDTEHLRTDDLAPLDEFHLGGRESTAELGRVAAWQPGAHLLDVGCGIGGPARYFAEQGYEVTGIDLTDEFVRTAQSLTRRLNLEDRAKFRQGNALEIPFAAGSFDGAYTIHACMNIADKAGVFREVARVLKAGGRFAICDIMRGGDQPYHFPLPWAVSPETSFVGNAEDYRRALEGAGFRILDERDRREFAVEFMRKMRDRMAGQAAPVLGVHLLMGEQAPVMLRNSMDAIESGALTVVEMVSVKA